MVEVGVKDIEVEVKDVEMEVEVTPIEIQIEAEVEVMIWLNCSVRLLMLLSYYIYFVEEMIVLRYHVPNYDIILSSTREIDLGETGDRWQERGTSDGVWG